MNESYKKLTNNLNYQFENVELLGLALTHRSVHSLNNERLEFLGDAILGSIIAEALFQKFIDCPEGDLTRKRASLVKKETLAKLARKLELGQFIQLGTGEKKSGGWRRDSILANTLEAIIGAVYLDSSYKTCYRFVIHLYDNLISGLNVGDLEKDSKTQLQEFLQGRKHPLPSYNVIAEEGEAHDRIFTVECEVEIIDEPVKACGKTKRAAEQSAAEKVLQLLQTEKI